MIVAACPGVLRHWGAFPGGDVGWAGTGGSAPSTVSATAQFSFCGAGGNRGGLQGPTAAPAHPALDLTKVVPLAALSM